MTRATITPSSAQMVSQPVKPTTASSAKSVYGVTVEEAELRYTNRPAQTRAVSPPRRQEHYKKSQYAWQTVRSKKGSSKWKEAPKHQQYSKLTSKPSDKHEKDSSIRDRMFKNRMLGRLKRGRIRLKHQSLHRKGSVARNVLSNRAQKNNHI